MKGEVISVHFLSDSKKITEMHMVRLRTSWWGGLWVLKPTDQKSDNKIPKCAGGGGRAALSFFAVRWVGAVLNNFQAVLFHISH